MVVPDGPLGAEVGVPLGGVEAGARELVVEDHLLGRVAGGGRHAPAPAGGHERVVRPDAGPEREPWPAPQRSVCLPSEAERPEHVRVRAGVASYAVQIAQMLAIPIISPSTGGCDDARPMPDGAARTQHEQRMNNSGCSRLWRAVLPAGPLRAMGSANATSRPSRVGPTVLLAAVGSGVARGDPQDQGKSRDSVVRCCCCAPGARAVGVDPLSWPPHCGDGPVEGARSGSSVPLPRSAWGFYAGTFFRVDWVETVDRAADPREDGNGICALLVVPLRSREDLGRD